MRPSIDVLSRLSFISGWHGRFSFAELEHDSRVLNKLLCYSFRGCKNGNRDSIGMEMKTEQNNAQSWADGRRLSVFVRRFPGSSVLHETWSWVGPKSSAARF